MVGDSWLVARMWDRIRVGERSCAHGFTFYQDKEADSLLVELSARVIFSSLSNVAELLSATEVLCPKTPDQSNPRRAYPKRTE